ncbi:hypothetical protein KCU64_g11826, partial [Aureobasidium melanogenum]
AAGIPTWSPTVVLICRSTAYVWQSGRDAQFSADCGRMYQSVNNISAPRLRPTMHADVPHKWLWCDGHSQVTKWYMNVPSRPRYNTFILSFVNTANRAWVKAINPQAKLSDLDRTIVECLLNDPIPADVMIATLQDYNHYIGGIKGDLKQTGLIPWEDEATSDAAIEKGVGELYKLIEKTQEKYFEAEDARVSTKGKGNKKNKGKGKAITNINNKAEEDEEMQDVDNDDEHTMPSFNDMNVELTAAGNAPATVKEKGKGKASVKFGELPFVGGKKKDDDDEEWKNFFLK